MWLGSRGTGKQSCRFDPRIGREGAEQGLLVRIPLQRAGGVVKHSA